MDKENEKRNDRKFKKIIAIFILALIRAISITILWYVLVYRDSVSYDIFALISVALLTDLVGANIFCYLAHDLWGRTMTKRINKNIINKHTKSKNNKEDWKTILLSFGFFMILGLSFIIMLITIGVNIGIQL